MTLPPVTVNDDLIASCLESFSSGYQTVFKASGGTNITTLISGAISHWITSDRIQLKQGGGDYLGVTILTSSNVVFRVIQYGPSAIAGIAGDNLPVLSRFVYGQFGAALQDQFVFFDLQGSNLVYRAVVEASPGVFSFGATSNFNVGAPIDGLYVLAGAPLRLMAIVDDGAEARIYDFNGTTDPVLHQTIPAPSGQSLTGAIPLGGGKFHLLSGVPGSGKSTSYQHFKGNGSNYAPDGSGALPSVNTLGINANVFLFQSDPFVNPGSGLVKQLNAADWSDSVSFAGGKVTVQAERLGTATGGLGSPSARDLGTKPAGAGFGLVNQYHPLISLTSLEPAFGVPATDIQISPKPGKQAKAVQVAISTAAPGWTIGYSINGGSWNLYSGPFWVYKNATIRYVAELPGGVSKTDVRAATYTFQVAPSLADSDGDGIPDYVEIAYGLDPTKGADTDGDGFTDLNEILKGTDPNSNASVPAENQRVEDFQSFDLQFALRPYDGTALAETAAAVGINGAVHTLDSSILRSAQTAVVPGAPLNPALTFTNVRAELRPALVSLSTESNFAIDTAGPDLALGRELLGVVATPAVYRPSVNYVMGNGTPAVEAAHWVAAAQAAYAATPHLTVQGSFGVDTTLSALLFERMVNGLLVNRVVPNFNATNLTLFGFRFGDSGRRTPTVAQLDTLSHDGGAGNPAYDLAATHALILSNLVNSVAFAKLRALGDEVYRISSLSNNAAPGYYPLPVDVLRQFLVSGALQSNYAAVTLLSPSDIGNAYTSAQTLIGELPPRPTAGFDLTVVSDSFLPDCTHLQDNADGTSQSLFAALGIPYKVPETFSLAPGAVVHVDAYTDFSDPTGCPGTSLQVIDATLISSPYPPIAAGGNDDLISDAWANFFFGGPVNPYGDDDGDGFSNLQEFLDGTDPKNPLSHTVHPISLMPPLLSLESLSAGSPLKNSASTKE